MMLKEELKRTFIIEMTEIEAGNIHTDLELAIDAGIKVSYVSNQIYNFFEGKFGAEEDEEVENEN